MLLLDGRRLAGRTKLRSPGTPPAQPRHPAARPAPAGSAPPAGDVGVLARAARRLVGAQRVEVVGPVLAGRAVDVGIVPGVLRHVRAVDVGALPAAHVARVLEQHLQALLARRVAAGVEAVEVERRLQVGDLELGRVQLGAAQVADDPRAGERREQAQDHEHHEELDQGEARLRARAAMVRLCLCHPTISCSCCRPRRRAYWSPWSSCSPPPWSSPVALSSGGVCSPSASPAVSGWPAPWPWPWAAAGGGGLGGPPSPFAKIESV